MSDFSRGAPYDDLPVPREALANGGVEMLRVGIVADELFVTARRGFDGPAQWGAFLAYVAHRLGRLYAEESDITAAAATAAIATGFAATLGLPLQDQGAARPLSRSASAKTGRRGANAKAGGPQRRPKPSPGKAPRAEMARATAVLARTSRARPGVAKPVSAKRLPAKRLPAKPLPAKPSLANAARHKSSPKTKPAARRKVARAKS